MTLYPRERPGAHCTGGWVGPRTGLDRCGKSRPPWGFDPWTVQPVASHYTDYTTRPILSNEYTKQFLEGRVDGAFNSILNKVKKV